MIALRVGTDEKLKSLPFSVGWVSGKDAAARRAGDESRASADLNWMPTEYLAAQLLTFAKQGKTDYAGKLRAPAYVKMSKLADGQIRITWACEVDPIGGLRTFRLYRDGIRFGTFQGQISKSNKESEYQVWNFGDEPDSAGSMTKKFIVPADTGSPGSKFAVSGVNHHDTASDPTPDAVG